MEPLEFTLNAFDGEAIVTGEATAEDATRWALGPGPDAQQFLAVPPAVDPADWTNAKVGWSLILPWREDMAAADQAAGADLPDALRQLWTARGSPPILRYDAASPN